MTWVGMYLGLVVGGEEAAAQASILIFPVVGLSNVRADLGHAGLAPVIASLAWTALLLAVFVPLCTARYARR
jgi:hypothetical protein